MRARAAAGLVLVSLLASGVPALVAAAQENPPGAAITPGDRIRFVAPPDYPKPVTGEVASLDRGMLQVDRKKSNGGPVEVRLSEVSSLEISIDRKRQTILGLGISAAVGLTLGGLLTWAVCEGPDWQCDDFGDYAPMVLAVAVPLTALGGLLGYFTYKDVWQEVPVR